MVRKTIKKSELKIQAGNILVVLNKDRKSLGEPHYHHPGEVISLTEFGHAVVEFGMIGLLFFNLCLMSMKKMGKFDRYLSIK